MVKNRYLNILYRYRRWLVGWIILLSLTAVGFRFDGAQIVLWWHALPLVAVTLVAAGLLVLLLYLTAVQWQLNRMRAQIDETSGGGAEAQIQYLTTRQREVLDLILEGKSNKEIMAELFIELSTLKTHINHIYKKLQVRSRSELRRKHS